MSTAEPEEYKSCNTSHAWATPAMMKISSPNPRIRREFRVLLSLLRKSRLATLAKSTISMTGYAAVTRRAAHPTPAEAAEGAMRKNQRIAVVPVIIIERSSFHVFFWAGSESWVGIAITPINAVG